MGTKTAPRYGMAALRGAMTKPKMSLFGGMSSSSSATPAKPLWDAADKQVAIEYVESKIAEHEQVLETTLESLETTKPLVLSRLECGIKMSLLIALTQLKNIEATRDHLYGVVGSLEHLHCEIGEAEHPIDYLQRCNEILRREPLKFSVKDESERSFDELKAQVNTYCDVSA
jgi:hypothetical protein